MNAIYISNKTIKLKDSEVLLIEGEVNPTLITFIIDDPNEITDVENLTFFISFYRSENDKGFNLLEKEFVDNLLYLTWKANADATLKNGKTKIQITGRKIIGTNYSVAWSTKVASFIMEDSLQITTQSSETGEDFISDYLGG